MEKIQILLVEDDRNFRQAVQTMLAAAGSPFAIAATALNGKEALSCLAKNSYCYDLLLTDVNMPIMNGVELVKLCRQNHPQLPIICLSAYDDFDLVKESLKNGAADYLLKTELTPANFIAQLTAAWENSVLQQKLPRLEEALALCCHNAVSENFEQLQNSLAKAVATDGMAACLLAAYTGPQAAAALPVISSFLQEKNYAVHAVLLNNDTLIFLLRSQQLPLSQFGHTLQLLESLWRPLFADAAFCCSEWSASEAAISRQYQQLQALKEHLQLYSQSGVYPFYDCSKVVKKGEDAPCSFSEHSHLAITELLQTVHSQLQIHQPAKATLNKSLLQLIDHYSKNHGVKLPFSSYLEFIEELKNAHTLEKKIQVVQIQLEKISEETHLLPRTHFSPEISKIIHYIRQHYPEDITLTTLARQANFSEHYLSNLFKYETGENVVTFINKVRIKQAKLLLQNSQLKAYEIAEQVGFKNASYFSTVFKKMENISLSAYKKGLRKS